MSSQTGRKARHAVGSRPAGPRPESEASLPRHSLCVPPAPASCRGPGQPGHVPLVTQKFLGSPEKLQTIRPRTCPPGTRGDRRAEKRVVGGGAGQTIHSPHPVPGWQVPGEGSGEGAQASSSGPRAQAAPHEGRQAAPLPLQRAGPQPRAGVCLGVGKEGAHRTEKEHAAPSGGGRRPLGSGQKVTAVLTSCLRKSASVQHALYPRRQHLSSLKREAH